MVMAMAELTIPYFSHAPDCEVSNIRCFSKPLARLPLQRKFRLPNLTMRAKCTESVKQKIISHSDNSVGKPLRASGCSSLM
jgi:hypothetical protein